MRLRPIPRTPPSKASGRAVRALPRPHPELFAPSEQVLPQSGLTPGSMRATRGSWALGTQIGGHFDLARAAKSPSWSRWSLAAAIVLAPCEMLGGTAVFIPNEHGAAVNPNLFSRIEMCGTPRGSDRGFPVGMNTGRPETPTCSVGLKSRAEPRVRTATRSPSPLLAPLALVGDDLARRVPAWCTCHTAARVGAGAGEV